MTGKVDRAGIIPFYLNDEGEIVMMFMIPSDPEFGGADFQIAKGKVDPGEQHEEAAVREGEEELGLIKSNMISDVHFLGKFLGRMHIYTVQVQSPTNFNRPHYETGQVGWLTNEQFQQIGRDLHKPIVDRAENYIQTRMLNK
jgi:8-oxo-dGTP pyrophosphatase MutT (NUDIX family)